VPLCGLNVEVLCRYVLRPAIAIDRVRWPDDGRVEWTLLRPWSDGTSRLVFTPLSFLARLATLVPPPRSHQVVYHGVLAPAAAWRREVVAGAPRAAGVRRPSAACDVAADRCTGEGRSRPRRLGWASLLGR